MKTKSPKEKKNSKLFPLVGRISFILAVLFLAAYVIAVLAGSGDLTVSFSERTALLNFEDDISGAEELAEIHYTNLYKVAEDVEHATSREEVLDKLRPYIGSDQFGDLRYFTGGEAYTVDGTLIDYEVSGADMIATLAASMQHGCTSVYYDGTVEMDCVAFFVPVRGSAYVDGLLSIVPARDIISAATVRPENAAVTMVLSPSGTVHSSDRSEDFVDSVGNDLYDFIQKLTHDHGQVQLLQEMLSSGKRCVDTISLSSGSYVLCISPLATFDDQLFLLTMTPASWLASPELAYLRHVVNICALAIAALVIGMIYGAYHFRRTQGELDYDKTLDAEVGCPNAEQFRTSATRLLQNHEYHYAVILLEIRQFQYLAERLSPKDMSEFLRFVAKVIETFCKIRETFGYMGEGKFAMAVVYENDRTLRERIRLIETVISKNQVLSASRVKKKFNIGISLAHDTRRESIQELLGYASIACDKVKNDNNLSIAIYTEALGTEHLNDQRIETEMEQALASGEFRLFLQPKYNITGDQIDSAEALVRWFDPRRGDYRFPGEFIGLFESNGFITELDHFMYIETLKYLSTAAERGEKVVPISVNVSMVTVSQPRFQQFYIENKKKYRVADDFITIEFTESFAAEDYGKIRSSVDAFHANGIRCSLDDFGSGYSSFGTLKHIPFDEVKFDRLFLREGHNRRADDALLEALFTLARSIGVRVVQEGVETQQMFDTVAAKGCDVIQGYYYSKPIPVEEYKLFVSSNTSIKYKSRVK